MIVNEFLSREHKKNLKIKFMKARFFKKITPTKITWVNFIYFELLLPPFYFPKMVVASKSELQCPKRLDCSFDICIIYIYHNRPTKSYMPMFKSIFLSFGALTQHIETFRWTVILPARRTRSFDNLLLSERTIEFFFDSLPERRYSVLSTVRPLVYSFSHTATTSYP